jgi:hypothetical protein
MTIFTALLPGTVVPAKAGIQFESSTFLEACRVDSRSPAFAEDKLRGNDVTFDGATCGTARRLR